MMYTPEEIEELRKLAKQLDLDAPAEFWSVDAKDLCKVCNGIGAEWMSEGTRKLLTKACACVEATAAIHDFEYSKAELSRGFQKCADDNFLLNGIKETLHKSKSILSLKFIWNTRKVLMAYLALRRLGEVAYAHAYFVNKLEEKENSK